jgi:VanZ family protein
MPSAASHTSDVARDRRGAALRTLPAVVWLGVIFTASSVPGSNLPGGWSVQGHLAEYAVLGALVVFALGRRAIDARLALAALGFCAFYGLTDEVHQAFVPGRMPDAFDWALDAVGSAAGIAACIAFTGWARSRAGARSHGRA